MLWHDKNKVRGLFIFLFCCSFESYTYCYGLCSKWVHYRWLSISIFFKKRFVLVRGILLSLLNECHICFPWSFLKVSLSENHSGESNTRCHFVFDTQSSFTQTHLWIYIGDMAKDSILVTVSLHSALREAIQECKHTCFSTRGLGSFFYLCFVNTSFTLKIPLCCTLSLWTMIVAFVTCYFLLQFSVREAGLS